MSIISATTYAVQCARCSGIKGWYDTETVATWAAIEDNWHRLPDNQWICHRCLMATDVPCACCDDVLYESTPICPGEFGCE